MLIGLTIIFYLQMSQIETVLTVLKDRFPRLREHKSMVAFSICLLFFGLGLTLTTNVSFMFFHILLSINVQNCCRLHNS